MTPLHRALQRTQAAIAAIDHQPLPVAPLIIEAQPQLPVVEGTALDVIPTDRTDAEAGSRQGGAGGSKQHGEQQRDRQNQREQGLPQQRAAATTRVEAAPMGAGGAARLGHVSSGA